MLVNQLQTSWKYVNFVTPDLLKFVSDRVMIKKKKCKCCDNDNLLVYVIGNNFPEYVINNLPIAKVGSATRKYTLILNSK